MGAWALIAAAAVGLTVLLVWPGGGHDRLAGTREWRSPDWLAARPDAASLSARIVVGASLGGGTMALTSRFWSAAPMPVVAVIGFAVAGATMIGLGRLEPAAVRRDRNRRVADTPQALDLLACCLAAGLPVSSALRAVVEVTDGPLAVDLGQVLRLIELGQGEAAAWRSLAKHEQLGPAALDLARSADTGSLLVEALQIHASVARDNRQGLVEQAARRVGVRSVLPLMACFIPAFVLVGIIPTVASAMVNAFQL